MYITFVLVDIQATGREPDKWIIQATTQNVSVSLLLLLADNSVLLCLFIHVTYLFTYMQDHQTTHDHVLQEFYHHKS